ncbi:MAG: DeoR/GlpR transcriptional regulator [Trueperaceae bacterium]|nr:DeoR/GlpR transcriptional regulator [Trueperaceae bacterium]
MIKSERHERILSELAKRGSISVLQLTDLLESSEATIRRDLNELDEKSLVQRTHGGVTLRDTGDELSFSSKVTSNLAEKRRIGVMTASLIQDGQVIGCSGGSTVIQVMKALKNRPIRVVTNAVNVAMEFAHSPETEVLVTGGFFRGRTYEMVGRVAERTLSDVNLDIALLGIDGLTIEHGLTTYNQAEAYVIHELVERAKEIWAVADYSKLGVVKPAVMMPIEKLSRLITDQRASKDLILALKEKNVDIVLA